MADVMSEKRFTVEEIEDEIVRLGARTDAEMYNDDATNMLRAFALQARQVEQMREFLKEHSHWHTAVEAQFTTLFPKDGEQ